MSASALLAVARGCVSRLLCKDARFPGLAVAARRLRLPAQLGRSVPRLAEIDGCSVGGQGDERSAEGDAGNLHLAAGANTDGCHESCRLRRRCVVTLARPMTSVETLAGWYEWVAQVAATNANLASMDARLALILWGGAFQRPLLLTCVLAL